MAENNLFGLRRGMLDPTPGVVSPPEVRLRAVTGVLVDFFWQWADGSSLSRGFETLSDFVIATPHIVVLFVGVAWEVYGELLGESEAEFARSFVEKLSRFRGPAEKRQLLFSTLANRPELQSLWPTPKRILISWCGVQPSAVIALVRSLAEDGEPVQEVRMVGLDFSDHRSALGLLQEELKKLGVTVVARFVKGDKNAGSSWSNFPPVTSVTMAEVQVILGEMTSAAEAETYIFSMGTGPAFWGALLQARKVELEKSPQASVRMVLMEIEHSLERDGSLPRLWEFKGTARYADLINPPKDKVLVTELFI